MNQLQYINAALVEGYKAMGLALPTGKEAKDFTPPQGEPWAQYTNLLGDAAPATMGDGGEDNYSGIFQIDFFVPENDGTGRLLIFAGQTIMHFKAGRVFSFNGQEVKVRRSSPSPIRRNESGGSYLISVSVYWDSRSQR